MPVQKITREELLEKSLVVFLQKGYHNTSMDDLAKACNLKKGSFYHYFKSKEELMKGVLNEGLRISVSTIFSCAYINDISAEKRLSMLFSRQQNLLLTYKRGCLFGNTALETAYTVPEFSEILNSFFSEWEKALTHIYENRLPKSEAKTMAINTIAMVEGMLMISQVKNNTRLLELTYKSLYAQFAGSSKQ